MQNHCMLPGLRTDESAEYSRHSLGAEDDAMILNFEERFDTHREGSSIERALQSGFLPRAFFRGPRIRQLIPAEAEVCTSSGKVGNPAMDAHATRSAAFALALVDRPDGTTEVSPVIDVWSSQSDVESRGVAPCGGLVLASDQHRAWSLRPLKGSETMRRLDEQASQLERYARVRGLLPHHHHPFLT